jgi:hypothetical protein
LRQDTFSRGIGSEAKTVQITGALHRVKMSKLTSAGEGIAIDTTIVNEHHWVMEARKYD